MTVRRGLPIVIGSACALFAIVVLGVLFTAFSRTETLDPVRNLRIVRTGFLKETYDYPLNDAVVVGDETEVRRLLLAGFSVDARDQNGSSSLDIAAQFGRAEIARLLIERGALPNAKGLNYRTALCKLQLDPAGPPPFVSSLASKGDGVATLRVLLEGGADPRLCNRNRTSLLDEAVHEKSLEAFELLLEHGASPAQMRYPHSTAGFPDTDPRIAERLKKALADFGIEPRPSNPSARGVIDPVSEAARDGDLAGLQRLIDAGNPIDTRDRSGRTPLENAITTAQPGTAKLLLDKGAPVNGAAPDGRVPLDFLDIPIDSVPPSRDPLRGDAIETLRILLEAGADPNHVSERGRATAFDNAVRDGNARAVELFLKHGGDPEAVAEAYGERISDLSRDPRVSELLQTAMSARPPK